MRCALRVHTPVPPVTADDRAEFVESVVERSPDQRRVAEELAGLMPDTKPLISSLSVDDEGRLWIGRVGPEDAHPQFDIFGRDGGYQGSVALAFQPAPYVPIRIRQSRVYTVVRDSMDVPFVVRTGVLSDASQDATPSAHSVTLLPRQPARDYGFAGIAVGIHYVCPLLE